MKRLAICVQRYGPKVTGGAEYHSRWVVQQLRQHFDLTIFTTTAQDYITWEEIYPPGDDEIDGVKIRRFPVPEQRDLEEFNAYSAWIYNNPHRRVDEERWLRLQGPYCPEMIEAIRDERNNYDGFLFFTYLYYTTVKGLEEVAQKSILLPTAHDEQAIRLEMFREVFESPRGYLMNTNEERRFVYEIFGTQAKPHALVGMGIEWPTPPPDPSETLKKYGIDFPYALSSGRICYGKGHDRLFRCYPEIESDVHLVMFGKLDLDLPDDSRIHFLGFVSEEEKWALTRGAAFTIHPSLYESLSLTLLESWAMEVPVVINTGCAVLREHVDKCDGGMYYRDDREFKKVFSYMAENFNKLKEMGERGKVYTETNYEARTVAEKYVDFINHILK
jgi:glycosyltransferase involved in cell wall biosynthesis